MFGLKEADKYRVVTIVDTNDTDYLTRISIIETDALRKFLDFFTSELKAQKAHIGIEFGYYPEKSPVKDAAGNIEISSMYSKRYIDENMYSFIIENIIPYNEYGMHTIVSVEVFPYEESVIFERNK